MLNKLRGATSGWVAKGLLGLLGISFVVWGIGDALTSRGTGDVITVGSTKVTPQDYALAYLQAQSRLGQQLQRRPTAEEMEMFGYDQAILSQLVSGALLDEEARDLGLGLSQERLARLIADDPTFHDASGTFSRTLFSQTLANARLNETTFIRNREQAAKRTQIVDTIGQSAALPQAFRTALGLYAGERRTVDFVRVSASALPPVADPSEDVLKAYFEGKASRYAAPEYRSIDYVVLSPETLSDPKSIGEEEIAADYQRSAARFTTPERRRVQQIVFADAAAATAADAKLKAGTSFEDVAREAGRSLADTDLGLVARSQIPDAKIADAAFTLPPNGVSGVVDGAFGPVILRIAEIQPEAVRPLSEVRDELRNELALAAASDAAASVFTAFEDARAGGATLADAANANGLVVKSVSAVDQKGQTPEGQPVADLPGAQEVIEGAFQAEPGFDNPAVNIGSNAYVFYDVTKIDTARERTLDEIRPRVVEDWKREEGERLLTARMGELETAARSGQTLEALAASIGATKETANAVTRQSASGDLGQAAAATAFAGGVGTVSTAAGPQPGERLLMKVVDVIAPADPMASVPADQARGLADALRDDLLDGYVATLRADASVSVDSAALEQAKANVR
ncbi:peptidylprolyl isomerase [Aurantimonas sp. Leaf443]|uniref:peptidylprolyl isomerase n=1 Tax=Aurantimonas sp. Leaf443 TaxID=1736378 RepID=UPI0006FE1201|nr:peptidylprolyl isomerase [Aurantimonas sp. Leaf443]KQT83456.1 peptidylprolyl isomerase [Aurantimonas sp. Leaf443]